MASQLPPQSQGSVVANVYKEKERQYFFQIIEESHFMFERFPLQKHQIFERDYTIVNKLSSNIVIGIQKQSQLVQMIDYISRRQKRWTLKALGYKINAVILIGKTFITYSWDLSQLSQLTFYLIDGLRPKKTVRVNTDLFLHMKKWDDNHLLFHRINAAVLMNIKTFEQTILLHRSADAGFINIFLFWKKQNLVGLALRRGIQFASRHKQDLVTYEDEKIYFQKYMVQEAIQYSVSDFVVRLLEPRKDFQIIGLIDLQNRTEKIISAVLGVSAALPTEMKLVRKLGGIMLVYDHLKNAIFIMNLEEGGFKMVSGKGQNNHFLLDIKYDQKKRQIVMLRYQQEKGSIILPLEKHYLTLT